jgi:alkanesulfonate monooxygenase SsuD/methylene tetrahydromethanopterin reductase-like flavin-dependent oxidoreductase (luciferase family)
MRLSYMPDPHFGAYNQPVPTPREAAAAFEHLVSEAELAEKVGFDGVWLAERHSRTETFISATEIVAAAIAARTERIMIATTVMNPTYHDPMHLAEQLASIDNLSKGRLIFGAGVGFHVDYFNLFNVPRKKTGLRFQETMDVIEGAWTQEKFSYKGQFYEYNDAFLTPKPYQRPRPTIWIGAFQDKAIERALNYDGWVFWWQPNMQETRDKIEYWREKAVARGKTDWTICLDLEGWVGDDPKKLREQHGHRWVEEANFHVTPDVDLKSTLVPATIEEMEEKYLVLGTPEQWVEKISEMQEVLNPDWLNIRIRTPRTAEGHWPSFQEMHEVIQRFGEEVIRPFQR